MKAIALQSGKINLRENLLTIFESQNYKPKERILIKPNFSGRPPLIPGENTDPDFLRTLIELLLEKGSKKVIIGHGGLLGTYDREYPFEQIVESGGFSFLYKMPSVEVYNFDNHKRELIEIGGTNFLIPTLLKEIDNYINLAKLKTHMEVGVSLALKNQMGMVAPGDRIKIHHTELDEMIVHLGKIMKPDLNIIDGIIAMEGNGPHHGKPTQLNLVIAGTDIVETDCLACYLVGIDFDKIQYIKKSAENGIGDFPSDETLKKFENLKVRNFKPAQKYEKFGRNFYVWPTRSCSRCITALNESGREMKKHPIKYKRFLARSFLGNKKINIIIGKPGKDFQISDSEQTICIGQCTQKYAEFCNLKCLNKCPPTVKETTEYLNKEIKK